MWSMKPFKGRIERNIMQKDMYEIYIPPTNIQSQEKHSIKRRHSILLTILRLLHRFDAKLEVSCNKTNSFEIESIFH
jgi:hypothetical protein